MEISGVVLVILYQHTVKSYVKNLFSDVLANYGNMNETRMSQNFDYIQHKLQCCGEFNYTDWQRTNWFNTNHGSEANVPQSCCVDFKMNLDEENALTNMLNNARNLDDKQDVFCKARSPSPNSLDNYYEDGCYTKLEKIIHDRFYYIAGMYLFFKAMN